VQPELQIICEASDGCDAVQKADELKPDLVLLDIGLPKLSGIEAARQIRLLSPDSKIIFQSQDNSLDVVQKALSTGALAYVHKAQAGSELLPAVAAVLRGDRFVSSSVKGHMLTATPGTNTPHRHEVLFYSDEEVLLESVTRFIAAALKAGNVTAVLATKSHRDIFLHRLKAEYMDLECAIQQGTYILLDAADALSNIMVNGSPDPVRFLEVIGSSIEAATKTANGEQPHVAVFGEAVALLQAQGKADAAIRLEQLWNDFAKTHDVDILCAYPLTSIRGEEYEHQFQSICAEHSIVCSR